MATIQSPINSYSDTTPQKRGVSDYVSIISPKDTPLIAYFGIQTDPGDFNVVGWPNTAVELLHDQLKAQSDTLNGSITSTVTTVTFTDADAFSEGDVVVIDSEYLALTARSASGEIWTVVRSVGGTTNASHADAAVVTLVTNARIEGADTYDSPVQDITSTTNYTQILHAGLKVTRTQAKMAQYGIDDYYEFQRMKKMSEKLIDLEKALIRGKRASGSGTVARMMGGLDYWLSSAGGNSVSVGGAITQAKFDAAMEAAYQDGGKPRLAVVSPDNMLVIRNLYDSSTIHRVATDETTIGMNITRINGPFGECDLLMSRWMPNSWVPLIDPDHFRILAFDDFRHEVLAKSGDYKRGEIVGEFTCLVRHPLEAHAELAAIS